MGHRKRPRTPILRATPGSSSWNGTAPAKPSPARAAWICWPGWNCCAAPGVWPAWCLNHVPGLTRCAKMPPPPKRPMRTIWPGSSRRKTWNYCPPPSATRPRPRKQMQGPSFPALRTPFRAWSRRASCSKPVMPRLPPCRSRWQQHRHRAGADPCWLGCWCRLSGRGPQGIPRPLPACGGASPLSSVAASRSNRCGAVGGSIPSGAPHRRDIPSTPQWAVGNDNRVLAQAYSNREVGNNWSS